MKFVVSSTELLSHLQAISKIVDSKNVLPVLENYISTLKPIQSRQKNTLDFNKLFKEYNFLFKYFIADDAKLRISKHETKKENLFGLQYDDFVFTSSDDEPSAVAFKLNLQFDSFTNNSTQELIRRLALYTGQVQATLLRVLRNARIHSLSIFFGLCCSRSGYIFEAITGSSSHPIPASL